MKQTTIKNDVVGEQYYQYTHESGLTILLYPMQGYSTAYALFGTKYGSIDTTFKTGADADFVTVPEGIAHFLEHKVFESEDGDAFSLFAKTGASANAFTSFDKTCYLFSTTDNFTQSLKSLINFVQDPYFTEETVKKEQGIIGQEIKMYEDDPNWRVFFNLLTGLYVNNPVRIDIAGTVESISKIDYDLLYKCYNTFYNLNNMVIAIAGNFNYEEAITVIEENLKATKKVSIERATIDEPSNVANPSVTQKLQVSVPLFNIGYKEKPVEETEMLFEQIKYEIMLSIIVGHSSELYKQMYDKGLINSTFGCEVFCGRGYMANIFAGESKNPQRVFDLIDQNINNLKQSGLSKEAFTRIKKSMYGRYLRMFNDVEGIAHQMVNTYFANCNIYDIISYVSEVTFEQVNDLFLESFNKINSSISVIEPIE